MRGITKFENATFTGERALYGKKKLKLTDCVFENGESPLKECENITLERSFFKWMYPLWYTVGASAVYCVFGADSRAGIWYSNDIKLDNCMFESPKNLRRCKGLNITNCSFANADETLWHCRNVNIRDMNIKGDYFGMNSSDMEISELTLSGKYSFDGCKNVTISDSRLISKDAFWNSDDVTVINSYISGEYIGWNSKKLSFINCTIESLQGLCYIENLYMRNCRLINTTLAFENTNAIAEIKSPVTSILNPKRGTISATHIGELIIEKERGSTAAILCHNIDKKSDHPEWIVNETITENENN